VSALVRLIAVVVVVVAAASGCAHAVVIEPDVARADVFVDGEPVGRGTQTIERMVIVGDTLRVTAKAEGYEDASVVVEASEWYPWPGLLALVPLLGIPIAIPVTVLTLPLLGVGLILGPLVAVGWAVVTSPTVAGLAFTRRYPERVRVKMTRKPDPTDVLLPADLFGLPDDVSPNPIPDVGPLGPPPPPPPPPSPGGNPLP
jgi:hypothetical protein